MDHAVVSVAPFLHCQHRFPVSTDVLAEKWCEAVGRLSVIPVVLTRVAGVAAGYGHFLTEIYCSAVGLPCRLGGRFSTAIF